MDKSSTCPWEALCCRTVNSQIPDLLLSQVKLVLLSPTAHLIGDWHRMKTGPRLG